MARFLNPNPQFLDGNGKPYSGGKLYSYDVGTLNAATTYSDTALSVANANPIILDANGRAGNIFYTGQLRFVLDDANDVQIWDRDYVGQAGATGAFSDWDSATTYGVNDLVEQSGNFYISIAAANVNNDPTSSATKWSGVNILRTWNTNETYDNNEIVIDDGNLYSSESGSNTGNDPASSRANWRPLQPDAAGMITSATTVDGYGIASVSQISGASYEVTFSNAADVTDGQIILVNYDQAGGDNTSVAVAQAENTGTTTAEIHGLLVTVPDNVTNYTSYPIHIVRYLI